MYALYETNSPPKHLRDCTGNSMENMYTDKTKCLTFIFHLPGTGIEVLLKIKKEDFVISKMYFRIPSFTDLFVRSTNY